MKAVQIDSYSGVDALEIKELAQPTPGEDQILVEVYAASFNPVDWKVAEGFLASRIQAPFPITLGGDFSGVVKSPGGGFKAGDEVFGYAPTQVGGSGSFAEYLVAKLSNTAPKPDIDFVQAAGAPLVGVSAIQALEEYIQLRSGQKILIHGGAGGIGSVAIQLAKATGAYVATTASRDDFEFVKQLGADEVVDYKNQKFEDILTDYDAVFDNIGGEISNRSFKVLKRGGVLVSMLGQPNEELAKQMGIKTVGERTNVNRENLDRLRELIEGGRIKIAVDKIYPLEDIKKAYIYQKQTHPRGKIVLKIK